jgi:hypothetical protein
VRLTNFRLDEEDRARLEEHKQAFGLPSEAAALRHLIRHFAQRPTTVEERRAIPVNLT